jgi:hypothetical protein
VNVFVPIETTWREAGCLIAVGSAQLEAAAESSEEQLGLAEMASPEFAGLVEVTVAGGQLQLIARVVDQVAVEKCRKQVYSGFSVISVAAADGSQRVRRVALVDSPSGFSKTLLKISKGSNMQKARPAILCDPRQVAITVREAKDRKAEAARIGKAMADNPPPGGGWPQRPMGEHQGTSTTAGGAGKDKAPFGQGQGVDTCLAAIRRTLATPYREGEGLVRLLASRAAA